MGEKAGPLDLTGRSFQLHGQDSAGYDAMEGDPLYKHTPYLISSPRPNASGEIPTSSYAIYHPSNSFGTWDVGKQHDDPSGYFKTYTQDFGGLEEYVIVGKGVKEIVRTFGEMVGMPKLVGRDWLGYLGASPCYVSSAGKCLSRSHQLSVRNGSRRECKPPLQVSSTHRAIR
jgi:alpha-glucosidase (family GH31 glycosyl hydrolase)